MSLEEAGHIPLRASILSYHKASLTEVAGLLKASDLHNLLAWSGGTFDKQGVADRDLVIGVFAREDSVDAYIQGMASVKLVQKVPCVLAVVLEGAGDSIREHLAELAADEILFLPMPTADFAKALKTHIASLRIGRKTHGDDPEWGRKPQALGSILVENAIITPRQLKRALDFQKETTNVRLGEALVTLGFIDESQKTRFLASQMDVPMATAKQYAAADMNVVALIPERIAREHHCLALERSGSDLVVAMVDVTNLRLLDNLRDLTDMQIRPILGAHDDISVSIDRFYHDISSHRSASDLMADLSAEVQYVKRAEAEAYSQEQEEAGAELGIIKLVNMLIANAVRDRASDIHIEPMEKELVVRYRIDGDLRRVMSPPRHSHQAVIARVKILSDLNIAERRLPQDGRMTVRVGQREVDLRVSVLPTIFGEKCVLRILDKEAFDKDMHNLGFTDLDLSRFQEQIRKPYGMIVVTGPTGSGKSTTLYSALQSVKDVARNIITVEDPVEFHVDGVTQVQVNAGIGLSFSSALRSILRQDPDTILVGEIRDHETADIAIKMALTGHLVFSTLHTNDAAGAITRFVDIGIPPLLLASSLNLVVAQRLVRRICPRCKAPFAPAVELLEQLGMNAAGISGLVFHKGQGCVACNGAGYSGRIGIYEMLPVSREVRKLILRNAPPLEIQAAAESEGMKTLRQAGIDLVLRGETTIEQVLAATTEA